MPDSWPAPSDLPEPDYSATDCIVGVNWSVRKDLHGKHTKAFKKETEELIAKLKTEEEEQEKKGTPCACAECADRIWWTKHDRECKNCRGNCLEIRKHTICTHKGCCKTSFIKRLNHFLKHVDTYPDGYFYIIGHAPQVKIAKDSKDTQSTRLIDAVWKNMTDRLYDVKLMFKH